MEGLKEFLESSTIHGLAHLSTNRHILIRSLWVCVVITGFSGAAVLIQLSFSHWAVSPVSTTIETLPIQDLDFPTVTVCPPRNSFTSLNPDVLMSRNITFDWVKRKELNDSASDIVYEEDYKEQNLEFIELIKHGYMNLYTGVDKILLPDYDPTKRFKCYNLKTTRPSGSFFTPNFRQPFDANFKRRLCSEVLITNINQFDMLVEIDFDIEELERITVTYFNETEEIFKDEELDPTRTRYYISLVAEDWDYPTSLAIRFERTMKSEYYTWTKRRNTGFKVTWDAPGHQNFIFTEDNKYFIQLANQIHMSGLSEDMENVLDYSRQYKLRNQCSVGEASWLYSNEGSMQPIHKDEITEETLEKAANIYFGMVFCPDFDEEIINYYSKLFFDKSPETILKTLTRILFVANEKNLTSHYNTAKAFFDKITVMMDLQYRDIVLLTTGASELEQYPDLGNLTLGSGGNRETMNTYYLGSSSFEELINHPVHITDTTTLPAVFIPYCTFGGGLGGQILGSFSDPVCSLFRKKIVNGQVCYEADVNQFKGKVNWEVALLRGFGFIVDTNDEYDVKNLFRRTKTVSTDDKIYTVYKQTERGNFFRILLKTISK